MLVVLRQCPSCSVKVWVNATRLLGYVGRGSGGGGSKDHLDGAKRLRHGLALLCIVPIDQRAGYAVDLRLRHDAFLLVDRVHKA